MPWAAAIDAVGTIAGAAISSSQASGTAQTSAGIADPFASQRPQYQNQLSTLMSDPSSIKNTPGYQFQFNQGMQALERSQAATGSLNSGQAQTSAIQFGQGLAETSFNNWESILAQLSGATIGSPGTAGSLYSQNQQQSNAAIQAGLGSIFSGLGNAVSGAGGVPTYDQAPVLPASAFQQ